MTALTRSLSVKVCLTRAFACVHACPPTDWRLGDDATFFDVIKQVAADETNHRDVNHTFASMSQNDVNPYVNKHLKDAREATAFWQEVAPPVEGKDLDFTMDPKVKPTASV